MKNRTVRLAAIIAMALLSVGSAGAQRNIIDEIVWMVGDEPILRSDIENQKLVMKTEGIKIDGNPDCFIPEQIAVRKLFLNQAKVDSVTVDEAQINRYVDVMLEGDVNKYFGSREQMERYFNKKYSQILEDRRRQVRDGEIVRQMQQKIVSNVRVSPSEIRSYFAKLPTDSLPYIPTTVEVRLISLLPHVSLRETDEIKARLRGYADEISEGKRDFSTLARLYSEDKRTAMQGGEYGFVARSALEPEFADALFNMPAGSNRVSQVIKTDDGYHIAQLIDRQGDMVNFRQILLRPSITTASITAVEQRLDSIATQITAGHLTFEKAAEVFSDDKDTRANGGTMVNKNEESDLHGSSRFTLEDLPQDISREIQRLKPGEISKPFLLTTQTGGKQVILVKLFARLEGHRANLTDDFHVIKQMALGERKQAALDEWIRKKQQETYINIDPHYCDCEFHYPGWIHNKQ